MLLVSGARTTCWSICSRACCSGLIARIMMKQKVGWRRCRAGWGSFLSSIRRRSRGRMEEVCGMRRCWRSLFSSHRRRRRKCCCFCRRRCLTAAAALLFGLPKLLPYVLAGGRAGRLPAGWVPELVEPQLGWAVADIWDIYGTILQKTFLLITQWLKWLILDLG